MMLLRQYLHAKMMRFDWGCGSTKDKMAGIPKEILDLLFAGESETLEFKTALRDPLMLARLIASFANTHGGTVLVGVAEPPAVVGVDSDCFQQVYEAALRLLEPREVRTSLEFLEGGDELKVAAVKVEKSAHLVLAQGSAYVRSGSMTHPMQWTQMLKRTTSAQPQVTLQTLAQAIEKQTAHLEKLSDDNEDLKDELRKANDPAAKWKERGYGFLFWDRCIPRSGGALVGSDHGCSSTEITRFRTFINHEVSWKGLRLPMRPAVASVTVMNERKH